MTTTTKITLTSLVLFSLSLAPLFGQGRYQAETDPIILSTDYDSNKEEYVISARKHAFGNYSIAIQFTQTVNLTPPTHFRTVVKSSGQILRLKPNQTDRPADCRYQYSYVLGRNTARPTPGFVYRLPFSSRKTDVLVDTIVNLNLSAFSKARPTNRISFTFALSQGDTIYAARKGQVVSVGNANTFFNRPEDMSDATIIRVEHADGTIAVYDMLEKGSMLVELGDKVFPDTPLALAGRFGEANYTLFFYVYRIENAAMIKGNEYTTSTAFTSTFLNPLFSTTEGDVQLAEGHSYTPVVTHELLTVEMTKKEIKSRKE